MPDQKIAHLLDIVRDLKKEFPMSVSALLLFSWKSLSFEEQGILLPYNVFELVTDRRKRIKE